MYLNFLIKAAIKQLLNISKCSLFALKTLPNGALFVLKTGHVLTAGNLVWTG
jgi:hypothetical protein